MSGRILNSTQQSTKQFADSVKLESEIQRNILGIMV